MLRIDITSAQVGDWLVLRPENGNIVAGVLLSKAEHALKLKVWLDAFAQLQISEQDMGSADLGERREYQLESTDKLYSSSELEVTPLLSAVNDIDDSNNYLDSLVIMGSAEG